MTYNGWVDGGNSFIVCGWATKGCDNTDRASLDLIINGKKVATSDATTFRADLIDAGVSDGYSGFSFCPFYWLDKNENRVRVVYSGTDIIVPNGELILNNKVVLHDDIDIKDFIQKPKISIVLPVYNIDVIWFQKAVESVLKQNYDNWELCIVDDASPNDDIKQEIQRFSKADKRIKVKYLDTNRGVSGASNEAVKMATGDYLALLDHDDEILENALFEIVRAINITNADIIYSDEHMINMQSGDQALHFKPDFSPDLLLSHNYITHFLSVRKELFDNTGGFSSGYDGAQDYDLVLRLTEKTDKIFHIPLPLYTWRIISTSVGENSKTKPHAVDAGKRAVEAAIERRNIKAQVVKTDWRGFYTVQRELHGNPLISIIISFRDKSEYLRKCIESVLKKSLYQNFEIIGINNGSVEKKTFQFMKQIEKDNSRVIFYDHDIPFNYSGLNNFGVSRANGEHVVLMNNDIEIINGNWIETMLEHSQRKEVGAVGGLLYYPNDKVQHAGLIVGIAGFAGHSHKGHVRGTDGYQNRLNCVQNISAVTGALMMVKNDIYVEEGGLDEEHFSIALNDVDFCLRLRERGYLNIFTPHCEAYHHESASRGYETTPEKEARFNKERAIFQEKWKDILSKGDPFYNPNLTLNREDFTYRNNLR